MQEGPGRALEADHAEGKWNEVLRSFVLGRDWARTEHTRPTTWLELLILFEAVKGKCVEVDGQRQDQQVTIAALIAVFKKRSNTPCPA